MKLFCADMSKESKEEVTVPVTAPSLGAVSAYSDQTSTAVGTGTGTGTVTSAHTVTAVGGGSGTVTTGQFVTELSIN